ncbi:hypothetical protein E4T39_04838 [Aureobasidium subglaciale]|nr:hypothetical protein E4T39_04838 [Aureobasidium subglaciale]
MPCRDETHEHRWPKEGTLMICRCEIFCGFCDGEDAKFVYTRPWDLREHVRVLHARAQGLPIAVSPRIAPNVSAKSKKRSHEEVEKSDSTDDDESDEDHDGDGNHYDDESDDNDKEESSEEQAEEDESNEEEPKTKSGVIARTPSDPFFVNDTEDTKAAATPLRLRADKPAAKAKEVSPRSHRASFKPIGPKSGPPSPKRAKQEAVTGPSPEVATNEFLGHPLANNQRVNDQYMQGYARVAGPNFQGPGGYSQQYPINVPPVTGAFVPPMNVRSVNMPDQTHGHAQPPPSLTANPPRLQAQHVPAQPISRNFYQTHPGFIAQPTSAPEQQRLRHMTAHCLTDNNMTEQNLIFTYLQEAEYVRQLYTNRRLTMFRDEIRQGQQQDARTQFGQMLPYFYEWVRRMAPPGQQPGPPLGQQSGSQLPRQSGTQPVGGMPQQQQQPGTREPGHGQQPGSQDGDQERE